MEDSHSEKNIKKRSLISVLSLFFQSGYSAVLGLGSNLILTIVLPPATFGIYILTLSAISFLNYFSDIGLAASLIQKKEISDDDVKTTFTVQQILILVLIGLAILLTPVIKNIYQFPQDAVHLYWALLISFFLSSLKTIPSIYLERKVQFQKIVLVQIIENTVFYITVSVLALAGLGLTSFTYAVIIRAIVGTTVMYTLFFWMPKIGISMKSLRSLLSFGLPFQTNSFLALAKDDLIMLFLGKILGLEALGYIGWAKRWAEAPIRIISDNINRILFPVFSRIQHDRTRIGRIIQKIVSYQSLLLIPVYAGMILLMHEVVYLIPRYSKWAPALPIFYLICISAILSSYSTPFINLFNALGKVRLSFKFMLYWTVMTWVSVPFLTKFLGIYGFPITLVFLSLTAVVIIHMARRMVPFHFLLSILPAVVAALIMSSVVFLITQLGVSYLVFFSASIIGAVVYFSILKFVFHINIASEIRSLFSHE